MPGADSRIQKYRALLDLVRVGDVEYSWERRWIEFEESHEFKHLSLRDQALAHYTIKRVVGDEAPWLVQENDDTDNLVGIPSPRHAVPSTFDDAMILSGARGWEISQELIDDDRGARKVLGKLALEDYVDLTVATMLYGSNDNGETDLSYLISEDDTVLRQTVGGTIHGDFAAGWKRFATSGIVCDPTGIVRNFAPAIEADHVRAYHSVEDGIAIAMLKYLAAGDFGRLEESQRILIDAIKKADLGRGGGNFADFGQGGRSYVNEIFVDSFREYTPGEVIQGFGVTPGGRDVSMDVVVTDAGVLLRNVRRTKNDEGEIESELLGTMPIAREEIPTFVATMAAASAGRTSLAQIGRAIATVHIWE